jgi:hypothetical protein
MQVVVEGDDWKHGCADVCIAGLGWVSCALKGEAELLVWRHAGIAVTTRAALLPDFAEIFDKPGWSKNTKALFKDYGGRTDDNRAAAGGKSKGVARGKAMGARGIVSGRGRPSNAQGGRQWGRGRGRGGHGGGQEGRGWGRGGDGRSGRGARDPGSPQREQDHLQGRSIHVP